MDKIDFKDVHSMIGAEMVIDGDVTLRSGLIIYGQIKGNVSTKGPVRVASTGHVVGNISASDIHINGKVVGDVSVSNRVVLGEKSTLIGDLVYHSLLIEEGAKFEGKCDLTRKVTSAPEPQMFYSPARNENNDDSFGNY